MHAEFLTNVRIEKCTAIGANAPSAAESELRLVAAYSWPFELLLAATLSRSKKK